MSKVAGAGLAVMFIGMIVLILALTVAYPSHYEEPVSQRTLLIYIIAIAAVALIASGTALLALSFDLDEILNLLRKCNKHEAESLDEG